MATWSMMEKYGLPSEKTWERRISAITQPNANLAETVTVELPLDHFIHGILLRCAKDTDDSNVDNVNELRLIGDGNKYIKKMTGGMGKAVCIANAHKQSTGFYRVYATDPYIRLAQPIPAWVFTSLNLEIDVAAAGAGIKNKIFPMIVEGAYRGEDLKGWKILIEKYLKWAKFGANTGEQEYRHERNYTLFGYLYEEDDGGALSDTKFNYLTLKAFTKESELTLRDKIFLAQLKEENTNEFMNALPTGYHMLEFPDGLPTYNYTALYSYLNIPTAGTNIGVKVLERYVL